MAAVRLLPAPPCNEPVSLDEEDRVDVTPYVRFEKGHGDINYGVLGVNVHFTHDQQVVRRYLLHFFPLGQIDQRHKRAIEGWAEGFNFPSALLKLSVFYEDLTIYPFQQHCVAINER